MLRQLTYHISERGHYKKADIHLTLGDKYKTFFLSSPIRPLPACPINNAVLLWALAVFALTLGRTAGINTGGMR